jgi:hypothetical protein
VYWFYKHEGEGRVIPCVGGYPRGHWSLGAYAVDVYLNGEKAAGGSFEIYE